VRDTPTIIAASLWPGAAIERSLFGTADPDAIWRQVIEACPVIGGAAATFTYTEAIPVELLPGVAETRAFIDEYELERGTPLATEERRAAEAAAVYWRAYAARCGHAVGNDVRSGELRAFAGSFL